MMEFNVKFFVNTYKNIKKQSLENHQNSPKWSHLLKYWPVMERPYIRLYPNKAKWISWLLENSQSFWPTMECWWFNWISFNTALIPTLKSYMTIKTHNSHTYFIWESILKGSGFLKSMKMEMKYFPVSIKNATWKTSDKNQ